MQTLTPPSSSSDGYKLADDEPIVLEDGVADDHDDLVLDVGNGNGNGKGRDNGNGNGNGARSAAPIAKTTAPPKPEPTPAISAPAEKASAPADSSPNAQDSAKPAAPAKSPKAIRRRRSRQASLLSAVPGWMVSAGLHGMLFAILLAWKAEEVVNTVQARINAAPINTEVSEEEPLKILADPGQRAEMVGTNDAGPSTVISATPAVTQSATAITEKSSRVDVSAPGLAIQNPIASMPSAPAVDFAAGPAGAGGGISGDVTRAVDTVDQALDQLAREILRQMQQSKLTVVWLFDESNSMKDDQQAVKSKFDRITNELNLSVDPEQKKSAALLHGVVGFGSGIHFEQEPTTDVSKVREAIDRLKIDQTGMENTLHAFQLVIAKYKQHVNKERRLCIVLVTDESGDDGGVIEPVRELCIAQRVPVYVVGRQSLFGADTLHLVYEDPVTKDIYWPATRRGPETADFEMYQYDGLHGRRDETPSGFASYELARLTKDTGGIYFILPNEEQLRVNNRKFERVFSMETLREYVPDYESRPEYLLNREKSPMRRYIAQVIEASKKFPFDHHFPVDPVAFKAESDAVIQQTALRLTQLLAIEENLRKMETARDRETEKRWQAAYDLMLAQTVVYQIKAVEYQHLLLGMRAKFPTPKVKPDREKSVEWRVDHSGKASAPEKLTEKKRAEAIALLNKVKERHPNTPWSDLAQEELNRGFYVNYHEWVHSARYNERARLVPKY